MNDVNGSALYRQIKNRLMQDLQTGVYNIGDKLPTEHEFCTLFQVSRTTIRQALGQLVLEGYLHKTRGKGTFVRAPYPVKSKIPHLKRAPLMSFADKMEELGRRPSSRILECKVIVAGPPAEEILQLPARAALTRLVRLRIADAEPVAVETSYIPWTHAPGLSEYDCTGSLYELLRSRFDLAIYRSVESVEPVFADTETAELLHIPYGTPSFRVKTIAFLQDDTPVEYSEGVYRNDLAAQLFFGILYPKDRNET